MLLDSLPAVLRCQDGRFSSVLSGFLFFLRVCRRIRVCVVGAGNFLLQIAAAGEVGQTEIVLGVGNLSIQIPNVVVFVPGVVVSEQGLQAGGIVSHGRGVVPIDALQISFPQVDLRQVELQLGHVVFGQNVAARGRGGPQQNFLYNGPRCFEVLPRDVDVLQVGFGGDRVRGRIFVGRRSTEVRPGIVAIRCNRCCCCSSRWDGGVGRRRYRRRRVGSFRGHHHRPVVIPVVLGFFKAVEEGRPVEIMEGTEGFVHLDLGLQIRADVGVVVGVGQSEATPNFLRGHVQCVLDDVQSPLEVVAVEQLLRHEIALGGFRRPVGERIRFPRSCFLRSTISCGGRRGNRRRGRRRARWRRVLESGVVASRFGVLHFLVRGGLLGGWSRHHFRSQLSLFLLLRYDDKRY
mmetsp:Transcript_23039/g.54432  ORF Transcript_23039/g.54432 Transcript_23039/m.54432 type:complete len:404 (-) Transcript_23039:10-1221(-)